MSEHDPRWRDDPELDEGLRALLEAGAAELPHDEQLERLEARLFPLIPPGGGGGVPATSVGVLAKAALALGGLAAIAGAVWMTTQPSSRIPAEPVAVGPLDTDASIVASAAIESAASVIPAAVADTSADAGRGTPRPVVASERPARAADPASELALVEAAQSVLASSPTRALALTRTHSRDYPDGALAQEREVIAIDALMRLDRAPAARTRAARFHERWPTSAHGRRVDVLVATH